MEREFVEEYKGVHIHVWLQTHTDTGYEYFGTGHNMVKNPNWTPPVLLSRPKYHAVSREMSATETTSVHKLDAIRKYKEEIDYRLHCAEWKDQRGYSRELFMTSELFLLEHNRKAA